jgi:hypothetical protein
MINIIEPDDTIEKKKAVALRQKNKYTFRKNWSHVVF